MMINMLSRQIILILIMAFSFFPIFANADYDQDINKKAEGKQYDISGRLIYDSSLKTPFINYPTVPQNPNQPVTPQKTNEVFKVEPLNVNGTLETAKSFSLLDNESNEIALTRVWSQVLLNANIGARGLFAGDFDGNGRVEIIVSNELYWMILEYNPIKKIYEQVWSSPMVATLDSHNTIYSSISKMVLNKDGGNGAIKILIASTSGRVSVYDAATRVEENVLDTQLSNLKDINIADGDNDGAVELIVNSDQEIVFFDLKTFQKESAIPYGINNSYSQSPFIVGDADNDGKQEIVLSDGRVLEYNGTTVTVEQDLSNLSFAFPAKIGDIDGDKKNELVFNQYSKLIVYDAQKKIQKWSQDYVGGYQTDMLLADCNKDGVNDLLYGDAQWGSIHCVNGITKKKLWSALNPNHGVSGLNIFDTDKDGALEVFWGAGATTTGPDVFYIYEVPSLKFEWKSTHIDGPLTGTVIDDVDNDDRREIVTISLESDSGYSGGVVSVYDSQTMELKWQTKGDLLRTAWVGLRDMKVAQLDADPQKEIVIAASTFYNPTIYIIDGKTHELEKTYKYNFFAVFQTVNIADIDQDQKLELIVSEGNSIYIIDPSNGFIKKTIPGSGEYRFIDNLYVVDLNNDGKNEFILSSPAAWPGFLTSGQHLKVVDPGTGLSRWYNSSDFTSVATINNASAGKDFVVGTSNGDIRILDGQNFAEKSRSKVTNDQIVSLAIFDFDGDGKSEIVFASRTMLGIYDLTAKKILWKNTDGGFYGSSSDLIPGDSDKDSLFDLVVGSGFSVSKYATLKPKVTVNKIKLWTSDPKSGITKPVYKPGDIIRINLFVDATTSSLVTIQASGSASVLNWGNWTFDIPVKKALLGKKVEIFWDVIVPKSNSQFLSLGQVTLTTKINGAPDQVSTEKFWIGP